ncbi:hypothetical protein L210DRAFT_3526275, partial [Boletus edulis BED1]
MNEVYTGGLGSYSIVCLATSVFSRCIQNYGGQKSSWRKISACWSWNFSNSMVDISTM